jgi:hypothetical protein
MSRGNGKLPDASVLRKNCESGMSLDELTERYGVSKDFVRRKLKRYGISEPKVSAVPVQPAKLRRPGIVVLPDRIAITREMTAGQWGGLAIRTITLARTSMQVSQLREKSA